jgi:hypothetical protein
LRSSARTSPTWACPSGRAPRFPGHGGWRRQGRQARLPASADRESRRLIASIGSIRDLRAVGRPRRVELECGGMREPGQVRAVRVDRPHVFVVVEDDAAGERREGQVLAGWSGKSCGGRRRGRTARCRAARAGHEKHEHCGRRESYTCVHDSFYHRAE